MTANRAEFPIAAMCAAFGVSRSGDYAWRDRRPSARARADAAPSERIVASHARSGATYGAPRIRADLHADGQAIGRKRVARLMRQAGLAGVSRRRGPRTPIRDARSRPAGDLVDRNVFAEKPDVLWVAESPPVKPGAGFTFPPGRAFCIWRSCSTRFPGASWAGRWGPT
jgi:putative transposase